MAAAQQVGTCKEGIQVPLKALGACRSMTLKRPPGHR